jgi:inner membrane protein
MASLFTHAIIPLSLKIAGGKRVQIPWKLCALGVLFTIIPDFDVIAFKFGIPYQSPFGHRGFTHSIVFAAICAALIYPIHKSLHPSFTLVWGVLFLSMLSHPLMDAMTNGGLGVALFWPLDETRYFLPWRPVKVSPIGIDNFFNQRGLGVILSEIRYLWIPIFITVFSVRVLSGSKTR